MNQDTFRSLLPSFSSTDLVFLQGWGEPLLHPELWTMVRQARETGARVGFTTNGMELDGANRRALLDSRADVLGVSLAGTTASVHGRFRTGTSLGLVDQNLRALRAEKEEAGSELPHLHLAYLLLADNVEDLAGLVDLAGEWGARQVVVSQLGLVFDSEMEGQSLLAGRGGSAMAADLTRVRSRAAQLLAEIRVRGRKRGIHVHAYGFGSDEARSSCRENILRSCFVSAAGDVSPCVMSNLGLRKRTTNTHRFQGEDVRLDTVTWGNVLDRPLKEIWWSPRARAFREVHRQRIWRGMRGTEGLPPPCHQCLKLYES
jgi:MoaA/NifB/PqqE/SkfB family radical SAM enzyme